MVRRWLPALLVLCAPALAHAAPSSFADAQRQGWLLAYFFVFAAGFLTSLTPCVYPMIPIVVGVFGARGESVTRVRAFGLATMYVLGMGVMYSALGVVVALSGKAFGAILANPWVVWPLVGFYALLAASMFGAFELNLPPAWQARLSSVGGKGTGGAFAMGLVGGLTAAPCTGPMLAGILGWVATTRNVPLGFSLLFTYAIGMGILFWVIATFAVALPKSGRWMEAVKSVAGIALLVVGVYFLRPVLAPLRHATSPKTAFLLASIGVAMVGVIAGGVHLSFHDRLAVKLRKGFGIALTVVGLVGVVNWTLTPKREVAWRGGRGAGASLADRAAALAEAKERKKPVLIDFGADYCLPCKEYDLRIFADLDVNTEIQERFVAVKFDVSDGTDADYDAQEEWRGQVLPTVILLRPDGSEARRFVGEEQIPSVKEFLAALREVK